MICIQKELKLNRKLAFKFRWQNNWPSKVHYQVDSGRWKIGRNFGFRKSDKMKSCLRIIWFFHRSVDRKIRGRWQTWDFVRKDWFERTSWMDKLDDFTVTGNFRKLKGGREGWKCQIKQPVVITVVWHQGKTFGLSKSEWELSSTDCSHSCF